MRKGLLALVAAASIFASMAESTSARQIEKIRVAFTSGFETDFVREFLSLVDENDIKDKIDFVMMRNYEFKDVDVIVYLLGNPEQLDLISDLKPLPLLRKKLRASIDEDSRRNVSISDMQDENKSRRDVGFVFYFLEQYKGISVKCISEDIVFSIYRISDDILDGKPSNGPLNIGETQCVSSNWQ